MMVMQGTHMGVSGVNSESTAFAPANAMCMDARERPTKKACQNDTPSENHALG